MERLIDEFFSFIKSEVTNLMLEKDAIKIERFNSAYFSDVLIITKWNFDYAQALELQLLSVKFVHQRAVLCGHPELSIFIFCNHPLCLTNGRGLQKSAGNIVSGLVDFGSDYYEKVSKELCVPYFKIKRGGGLTFHHTGQWIFYPIVNLNTGKISFKELLYWVLEKVKQSLEEEFCVSDLDYSNKFLGIWWKNDLKLASIGVGIEHFVTYHGIALNLVSDQVVFDLLKKVNPCGLSSETYVWLNNLLSEDCTYENRTDVQNDYLYRFQTKFSLLMKK